MADRVPCGACGQQWPAGPAGARDDDLLALSREDGVSILGPGGELQVEHVREVASTDPLVVYGVGGIMRLDRSLVAGEDARPLAGSFPGAVRAG